MTNDQDYRLQLGDTIMVSDGLRDKYTQKNKPSELSESMSRKILEPLLIYENENIAVINKSAGFTVQGGTDPLKNIFTLMASRYKKDRVHVIHRLDKVTSGVVLMAKNRETAQCLQMAMEERENIHKYYLALCEGQT